jgi:uncharacterized protein YjdB
LSLGLLLSLSCGGVANDARSSADDSALAVSPTVAALVVGGRTQLEARGPVGRSLSWRSANPAVAVVDASGVVHAVSAGRATIIATLVGADGTTATASASVTVQARPLADSTASRRHRRH